MAKKKTSRSHTYYLPDDVVKTTELVADQRNRSTSFIVAQALKQYLREPQHQEAHLN